jgi:PPOX class probable F420-dependent enzyme
MTIYNELENATFVALETFKKNGDGVVTPTWITGEDSKLYIWTELDSWKVKRIRNNPAVRICQSDYSGNPKGDWYKARAQVLETDTDREKAHRLFRKKYGLQFWFFSLMGRKSPKVILEITAS